MKKKYHKPQIETDVMEQTSLQCQVTDEFEFAYESSGGAEPCAGVKVENLFYAHCNARVPGGDIQCFPQTFS